MVRDSYLGAKPTGNHLSPRCPRLAVLVDDGGVAAKIDGRNLVVALNVDGLYCRSVTVELQCQLVVPSQILLLTVFDAYLCLVVDAWRTLVDHKFKRLELAFWCSCVVNHQSPALGTDGRLAGFLLGAEHHPNHVVAVVHLHGKVEGLTRFLLIRGWYDVVTIPRLGIVHRLRLCHVKVKRLGHS